MVITKLLLHRTICHTSFSPSWPWTALKRAQWIIYGGGGGDSSSHSNNNNNKNKNNKSVLSHVSGTMVVEMVVRARVELLQRIMSAPSAQADGGRGEYHGYYLVEQQRAAERKHQQPVVKKPIGNLLPTTDAVQDLVCLQSARQDTARRRRLVANHQVAWLLVQAARQHELAVVT